MNAIQRENVFYSVSDYKCSLVKENHTFDLIVAFACAHYFDMNIF